MGWRPRDEPCFQSSLTFPPFLQPQQKQRQRGRLLRRAGCAGACRAPAPLCLRAGGWSQGLCRGSGAGMRCQSPERRGGCLEGFVPSQPRVRTRCGTQYPIPPPPQALLSPALAGGGSTRGAGLGFGNLIRAVPGAGAALGSPAGAGAAEQVWARLLHGSGQFPVPWAVSAGTGKGPYKHHSKVGTPKEASGAVEGAPWVWGALEAGERLMLMWGRQGGSTTHLIAALPWRFHVALSPRCAAGRAELPGNQICMNRMFGLTTSALGSFKKMGDKNISHVGRDGLNQLQVIPEVPPGSGDSRFPMAAPVHTHSSASERIFALPKEVLALLPYWVTAATALLTARSRLPKLGHS